MTLCKLLVPAMLLLVTACTSERTPYWGQNMAEFRVATPTAEAIASGTDEFTLTNKQRFLFYACISDLDGKALPPGLVFTVQTNSTDSVDRTTDLDGCIDWEREIGYTQINSEKNYVLKTKFISKNQIKGTYVIDLVLNPISSKVSDLRDRRNSRQDDLVVVENDKINIQRIDRTTPPTPPRERAADDLVITNVLPEVRNQAAFQVTIDGFGLEKRRLDIAKPYSVDSLLNLSTHNIYKLSAKPQFLVKRFNNQVELLSPKTGKFRMTLAFMAEPDFDVNEFWKKIEALKILEDIKGLNDITITRKEAFEKNITRILTTRASELKKELSLNEKRILMSQLMLPFVHQTHQTVAEMTADFGLQTEINVALDQTSLHQKRAMIAITIEPISSDLQNAVKADGAGIAPNMFAISGISNFLPMKIEADLIHRERQSFLRANQPIKALEIFESIKLKEKGIFKMTTENIPRRGYFLTTAQEYPFLSQAEAFLNGQLNPAQKQQFFKSLCYKIYHHPETKSTNERLTNRMLQGCERNYEILLELSALEFVDSLVTDKADLLGPVLASALSISQSFSKSAASSQQSGTSLSASAGVDIGFNLGFGLESVKGAPATQAPQAPPTPGIASSITGPSVSGGFKASVGHTWFYTESKAKTLGGSTGVELSTGFKLNIETSTFRLKANTQRCLFVKTTDEIIANLAKSNIQLPQGLYFCSKQVKARDLQESFYQVRQECISGSPIADCSSEQENGLTMMIRGHKAFNTFERIVTDSKLDTLLMPVSGEFLKGQIFKWETNVKTNSTTQIFPGAVSTSVIQLN